jgi:hypothetical protein
LTRQGEDYGGERHQAGSRDQDAAPAEAVGVGGHPKGEGGVAGQRETQQ